MTWRRFLVPGGWRGAVAAGAILAIAFVAFYVPAALAFPYYARIGATSIYADRPIDPSIRERLARADRLLAVDALMAR